MSNSTVYDVKVRYALDDRASQGAKGMASSFDRAAGSAFSLKGAIIALAGGAALGKAKNVLIDFNSQIDQMKIGLSTVMQMQLHMPLVKANKEADKLFTTFQEMAKKSPATTKDFMEMANSIAPAVAVLGGGPDKLAKLTQGAVTASIALGERADVAALDIKQMLMGTVSVKDRLAQQLLASQGIDHLAFNQKSGGERADLVEKMLSQSALKTAADQFGDSFKGQISTIQDQMEIALGQVGKPLMASITDEVRKMNSWIEKHPKLIADYGAKLGNMIKNTFEFVRNAAGWIVENKEILFTLGKSFLIFKGAQLGTNVLKGFVGGMTNLVESMKTAGSTLTGVFSGGGGLTGGLKGLLGVLTGAGGVVPAFGLLIGAVTTLNSLFDIHAEDNKKARNAQISLHEATQDLPELANRRKDLQAALAGKGTLGGLANTPEMRERFETELAGLEKKIFDPVKMGGILRKISEESKAHGGSGFEDLTFAQMSKQGTMQLMLPSLFDSNDINKSEEIRADVIQILELFRNQTVDARREILKQAFPEQWGRSMEAPTTTDPASKWQPTKAGDVNVTIHKIEIASEDPDRFVFGLAKIGEQAAKHPTASQHATPGGF